MYRPSAEQHTVAYPAVQNWREIKRRRDKDSPYYKGPLEDGTLRIWRADIMVMWKKGKSYKGPFTGRPFVAVFSVLNGVGKEGDSVYSLTRSLRFGGVAGTPTLVDSDGKAPYQELPALFGGTITVLNSGNSLIYNGDRLFWKLSDDPYAASKRFRQIRGRADKRITVSVEPYRPEEQKLNASLIRRICLLEEKAVPDDRVATGARNVCGAFGEAMLIGVMLSEAGAFGTGAGSMVGLAGWTDTRMMTAIRNTMTNVASSGRVRRAAQALGVQRVASQADVTEWRRPQFRMQEFIAKLLVPRLRGDYIAPLGDQDMAPQGLAGDVFRAQTGLMEKMLQAVVATNDYTASRIFGTAFTSAAPNQAVDINLGHYAS